MEDIGNVGICRTQVSQETEEALIDAFEGWYGYNSSVIEGGGYGDVSALFSALTAAYANSVNADVVKPSACSNSDAT